MKRFFFLVVLSAFLFCPGELLGAVLSGPVVNPGNGNNYYLLAGASWTASQAEAEQLGGNLVTINDAAENAWVASTFSAFAGVPRDLWIGLTDQDVEQTFVWASGEPVSYTNWSSGEPNNADNLEDYGYLIGTEGFGLQLGSWNDIPVSGGIVAPIYGVVEVQVPEPCTFALAATVSSLLLTVRFRL